MTISLSNHQRKKLQDYHESFENKTSTVSKTAAVGIFILVASLITLMGALLCLTLPHVNVISQIILPGVLPGSAGLLASIPLLIMASKKSIQATSIRKAWLKEVHETIQTSRIEASDAKMKQFFVEKELLPKGASRDYKEKLLNDYKAFYPKNEGDQTPAQKEMIKALQQVIKSFYPNDSEDKEENEE